MTALVPETFLAPFVAEIEVVRQAFTAAFERAPDLAGRIVERVHAAYPAAITAFPGLSAEGQEALLEGAIRIVLGHIEDRGALDLCFAGYARALRPYAVPVAAYGWLGRAILDTLGAVLADVWTARDRRAVARCWREVAITLRA